MKQIPLIVLVFLIFSSCRPVKSADPGPAIPLIGSWQLISGLTIQGKDTQFVDYTRNQRAIKIINATHFCFLVHDLDKGRSGTPNFSAGGGHYTLEGDRYTEFLEYCNAREWENNKFTFTVSFNKDTLVQQGIEKIDSIGVNRLNIEKYVRLKP